MGIPARHELVNTWALRRNAEVFSIFEAVGWTEYFQHLNGFHTKTTIEFTPNLTDTHSEVRGMCIEVTKAIVVEVTCLPQIARSWFG